MECVNDFLDKELFKKIQDDIFDKDSTPWFCIPDISGEGQEKDAYFCHMLYDQERPCSNKYWIAEALKFVINARSLIRVKVNLYPRTDTLVHHTPHTDYDFDHKAAVLSLSTTYMTLLESNAIAEGLLNLASVSFPLSSP